MEDGQVQWTSDGAEQDTAFWDALFAIEEEEPQAEPVVETPAEVAELLGEMDTSSDQQDSVVPVEAPAEPDDPGQMVAAIWAAAAACMAADETVKLEVVGSNKGGLTVEWNGLPGFVPASQLLEFPEFHVRRERQQALDERKGQTLTLKMIEVNADKNRLILSERAAQVPAEAREDLIKSVSEGDTREGVVSNLTDFGAFVDLGGVEGLIHKSELSWARVSHPSETLEPGQTVRVLVLSVDPDEGRVALSMKRLRENPWNGAEDRYKPGQIVNGVIGAVTSFGAFVILEDQLEGLVHISELAEGSFLHPRDVVSPGQAVTARVLHVDSRAKRLGLSLRSAAPPPEA